MRQSRRASLLEAGANVAAGYAVAVAVQLIAYPALGIQASLADSLELAGIFTLVSIARSYALRRLFERFCR